MSCSWGVMEGVEDLLAYFRVIGEEGFLDCNGGKRGKKMIGEQGAG